MQTLKIEFTDDEANALIALMDAGVRAAGIQVAHNASSLLAKFEAAIAARNAPPPTAETEKAN